MVSSIRTAKVFIKTNKTKQKTSRPVFVTEMAPNKKFTFQKN